MHSLNKSALQALLVAENLMKVYENAGASSLTFKNGFFAVCRIQLADSLAETPRSIEQQTRHGVDRSVAAFGEGGDLSYVNDWK